MADKIKGIILLCVVFKLVTGRWPDFTDLDAQRAVEECLSNGD